MRARLAFIDLLESHARRRRGISGWQGDREKSGDAHARGARALALVTGRVARRTSDRGTGPATTIAATPPGSTRLLPPTQSTLALTDTPSGPATYMFVCACAPFATPTTGPHNV